MAEMRASPVKSKALKRLADIVRMAEEQGQMEFLPVNPMSLFPVSSSTLENLAYGNLPMAIPSQSNIPITKTGRKQEVAELAGLLPTLPAASRGVTQGANYLGDVMTQAVTRNPQATSMRALEEIGRMSPVPQMVSDKTKQFLQMAEKGRIQMAKDRARELKDLTEGKSRFAEVSLNWDDPETYDLVDEYAKKSFKTKVVNQGGRNVTYLFKDEGDLKGVLSAVTPADYGRAYGYSDEDIARFYLERGLGPQDFFEDMNKDPLQQFLSGR